MLAASQSLSSMMVPVSAYLPICPEDKRCVFERSTCLDEARIRGERGAGLGLAIIHEAVAIRGSTRFCANRLNRFSRVAWGA